MATKKSSQSLELKSVKDQIDSFLDLFTYYDNVRKNTPARSDDEEILMYPWVFYESIDDFLNQVARSGMLSSIKVDDKERYYALLEKFDGMRELYSKYKRLSPLDAIDIDPFED